MTETNWTPAVTVLLVGLGLGIVLALVVFVSRRRARSAAKAGIPPAPSGSQLADLHVRRDQLLAQLREDADMGSASQQDRAKLEKQAALVLREISELEAQTAASSGAPTPVTTAQGPAKAGSELRGAIKALVALAIVAGVGYAVWKASAPREDGAPVTGTVPSAASNSGGMLEGHPTGTEANPIHAEDTPRLKQARAALAKSPDSIQAKAELGYALAEAGGWIEVYQNAQAMLGSQADHPDALIQLGMVRFAMGQVDDALNLIDQVLKNDPANVRALEVGGRMAYGGKKWHRALAYLETARERIGTGTDLDGLIEDAKKQAQSAPKSESTTPASTTPAKPPHAMPPQAGSPHAGSAMPPQAGSSMPPHGSKSPMGASPHGTATHADGQPTSGKQQPASSASSLGISGTIRLAKGATAPAGAVLYVIARPAGNASSAPVAVERLQPSSFPVSFTLAQTHGMSADPLPSKVTVSARLDTDGNLATRQSGDLAGQTAQPVGLNEISAQIVLAPAQ